MATYGGSHTNFDSGDVMRGAVAGSAMIAGALGRGLVNLKAQRESAFASWTEHQVRTALDYSEEIRAHEHTLHVEREAASAARIAALETEVERTKTSVKLALAHLKAR
jgi:hypothetical protein